jgi:hypothetical protein
MNKPEWFNELVRTGILVPRRYRFDLVRWNDRDELEHLPLIVTVNDIPPVWAITRRKPL